MIDLLLNYGLFLAKGLTIVFLIWLIIMLIMSSAKKVKQEDHFEITHLNQKYENIANTLRSNLCPKKELKKLLKEQKKRAKKIKKGELKKSKRVFVLHFIGNIKATAARILRNEVSAVLSVATANDEVLVCLENSGGYVHDHGFAASQLQRVRDRNIPLTVAVDKVAASGGYMMACVANKIIAAPFAIIGSIGVLAQLPNFNRLLERNGIDFEQFKAGELKRTVTLFGKNTDEDRARFTQQLEDTHALFKEFVARYRPQLDISKVATGEHWLASRAIELNLIDEIKTSDDFLLKESETADIYEIQYAAHKTITEKLASSFNTYFSKFLH